jgi:hypothetical protein
MRSNQPEVKRTYVSKNLPPHPVFFNEPEDLAGFTEGEPSVGRIVAIKSVLYSDGSAKRWYRVEALKKKNHKQRRAHARVKKKKRVQK